MCIALSCFGFNWPKRDAEANACYVCSVVEAESGRTWSWNEKIEERAWDWEGRNGSLFCLLKYCIGYMNPC